VALTLSTGETLRTTAVHRVFSRDRFVAAGALAPSAPLASLRAEEVHVVAIETMNELTTVYNLGIARAHTFFVGESAVWVHNLKDPKDPNDPGDPGNGLPT
jgi:hypothetical protein